MIVNFKGKAYHSQLTYNFECFFIIFMTPAPVFYGSPVVSLTSGFVPVVADNYLPLAQECVPMRHMGSGTQQSLTDIVPPGKQKLQQPGINFYLS